MQFGSNKQLDVVRLKADIAAASVELLSAQVAADRVRLQYHPHDIVTFAERSALKRAIASAQSLCQFFAQIEAQIKHREGEQR